MLKILHLVLLVIEIGLFAVFVAYLGDTNMNLEVIYMKGLRVIVAALALVTAAFAQLPDAPQPQFTDYSVHNYASTFKPEARGKKKLFILAATTGFELIADSYDIHETEKGLKAGVALEGNTWLVGSRPSAKALWGQSSLELGLTMAPAVLSYVFRQTALYYGTAGAPVILAIKHIQGGNQWKALLAGKKPTGGEQGPE